MHFDIGSLINIISVAGMGLIFVTTLGTRLSAVEKELGELRDVVVQIARQEERMSSLDQRMTAQGLRLDETQKEVVGIIKREASS